MKFLQIFLIKKGENHLNLSSLALWLQLGVCTDSLNSNSMIPIIIVIGLSIYHVLSQEFNLVIVYMNRKFELKCFENCVSSLSVCWKKKPARNWANLSVSS